MLNQTAIYISSTRAYSLSTPCYYMRYTSLVTTTGADERGPVQHPCRHAHPMLAHLADLRDLPDDQDSRGFFPWPTWRSQSHQPIFGCIELVIIQPDHWPGYVLPPFLSWEHLKLDAKARAEHHYFMWLWGLFTTDYHAYFGLSEGNHVRRLAMALRQGSLQYCLSP